MVITLTTTAIALIAAGGGAALIAILGALIGVSVRGADMSKVLRAYHAKVTKNGQASDRFIAKATTMAHQAQVVAGPSAGAGIDHYRRAMNDASHTSLADSRDLGDDFDGLSI